MFPLRGHSGVCYQCLNEHSDDEAVISLGFGGLMLRAAVRL